MNQSEAKYTDKLVKHYQKILRGEVLASELTDLGIPVNDIEAENLGSFFRPFRHDIVGGKTTEIFSNEYIFTLLLSRNGLYDMLPEGLSHKQEVLPDNHKSVKKYAELHKLRKKEEQEARSFFKPFENEFFKLGVILEKTEKNLLCLQRESFFSFLTSFWGIDTSLPAKHQAMLLYILPYAHEVAGNFGLIAKIIANSLNLNVCFRLDYIQEHAENVNNKLGRMQLGNNAVIGNITAPIPRITFEAGEVCRENIAEYINNGAIAKYIKLLFGYLVPLGFRAEIKWKVRPANVTLRKSSSGLGYLGYTV
ncbi:MAG: hypothetical protein JXB34_02915 [Bacteroidales bacterium]|nr:hypothetical protein [Bacteroidales bacterium]